jgi:hypothetical protein
MFNLAINNKSHKANKKHELIDGYDFLTFLYRNCVMVKQAKMNKAHSKFYENKMAKELKDARLLKLILEQNG